MKIIVTVACLFLLESTAYADALDDIIAQTQSADPAIRMSAFPNLAAYLHVTPVDLRAVNATIALLTLETQQADAVDDDADYYGDLIATTAQLNSPSAIPALVQVIDTGNLVPKALAQLGPQVLDPVLARATDPDWLVRKCVMIMLINALNPQNLSQFSDSTSIQKITLALEHGMQDPINYVSSTALKGFQTLSTILPSLNRALNVSTVLKITSSGLAYSRVNQTFNGTVTVTNIANAAISGPLQLVLTSLTGGVTLADATGSFAGNPYITVPLAGSLGPGQSATAAVQFKNPSNAPINFTPVVYSGSLN